MELLFLLLIPYWNCWCSWWYYLWSHFLFCWYYRFCWSNVIAAVIVNGPEWLLLLLLLFLFSDTTATRALKKTSDCPHAGKYHMALCHIKWQGDDQMTLWQQSPRAAASEIQTLLQSWDSSFHRSLPPTTESGSARWRPGVSHAIDWTQQSLPASQQRDRGVASVREWLGLGSCRPRERPKSSQGPPLLGPCITKSISSQLQQGRREEGRERTPLLHRTPGAPLPLRRNVAVAATPSPSAPGAQSVVPASRPAPSALLPLTFAAGQALGGTDAWQGTRGAGREPRAANRSGQEAELRAGRGTASGTPAMRGRGGGAPRLPARGRCRPPLLPAECGHPPPASISQSAARERGRKSRAPESGEGGSCGRGLAMALETLSPDWEFDRLDDGSQSEWGWGGTGQHRDSRVEAVTATERGRGGRRLRRLECPPGPLLAPHVRATPLGTGGREDEAVVEAERGHPAQGPSRTVPGAGSRALASPLPPAASRVLLLLRAGLWREPVAVTFFPPTTLSAVVRGYLECESGFSNPSSLIPSGDSSPVPTV